MPSAFFFESIFRRFIAPELTLLLLGFLTAFIIPGTFGLSRTLYRHPLFIALLTVFAVHLLACTVSRWQALARSTVVIHAGVLVCLAAGLLSTFGYVATVNIYEGGSVDTAYRWDLQQDAPLDVRVTLHRINREFYPVPLRIGILKNGQKHALIETMNGATFNVDDFSVQVLLLDVTHNVLELKVSRQGKAVGTCDTDGNGDLPKEFPYRFKLVSYQNPILKRIWLDLSLTSSDRAMVSGSTEVNRPFSWHGLTFHHVQVDQDKAGSSYAGLQIVRDPGRPLAFIGFVIIACGAICAMIRRIHGI
ncbi:MAG TPA: ResB-like family cytochrome C biogenesis protein [Geobacteraceae bacterium]